MSDVKYCPSCGTSLSITAAYCHQCGQKQKLMTPEAAVTSENIPDNATAMPNSEPVSVETSLNETINSEVSVEPEVSASEMSSYSTQPVVESPEVIKTPPEVAAPVTSDTVTASVTPAAPVTPQSVDQSPVNPEPAPSVQSAAAAPSASIKPARKKKFPWVFTVLWVLAAIAVGVWSYFVCIHPEYDYPVLTEDAQRWILLTVAIALLVYTLTLKLTMKKLKALPTVLLVIAALVVFYFFCMVELTDNDLLHDVLSDITEKIIPASGH